MIEMRGVVFMTSLFYRINGLNAGIDESGSRKMRQIKVESY